MDTPYTAPTFGETAFNCPHCGAFSNMHWVDNYAGFRGSEPVQHLKSAHCRRCEDYSLWINEKMTYPSEITVESPNSDLPEDIKQIYMEAAGILNISPTGSAALLRLAVEKLTDFLNAKGKDLNQKIGYLVTEKKLNPKIQKSLDIVRVVGNNAVHPGQIDFTDTQLVAENLFSWVNIIAREMITEPNKVNSTYEKLIPENTKKGIIERDLKKL
jgi:hypothetical protein